MKDDFITPDVFPVKKLGPCNFGTPLDSDTCFVPPDAEIPFDQNAVHAAMTGCADMVVGHWSDSFPHVPIEMSAGERRKIDTNGLLRRSVRMGTWPEYR